MSEPTIVHVDAFTDHAFSGNAAAVCVLAEPRSEAWMQHLAGETNLPATVFLRPQSPSYSIRWFTPSNELPLCGHGTLAAAHTLWTEGHVPAETAITFHSTSHTLTAAQEDAWIWLDFPAIAVLPVDAPTLLQQGISAERRFVGRSHHSYLVEVASEAEVRALTPDHSLLARLDPASVIVTARADSGEYDFVSRYFAPCHGIVEDPATGSAHCVLGPYWTERLGKFQMVGYQASSRGGVVRVRVDGDRVTLGGQAVTVLRSKLMQNAGL